MTQCRDRDIIEASDSSALVIGLVQCLSLLSTAPSSVSIWSYERSAQALLCNQNQVSKYRNCNSCLPAYQKYQLESKLI